MLSGQSFGCVNVVCGGSTLKHPRPSRWTHYHQLLELSVEAFQASEMLVGPVAVMRRFVGVVGRGSIARGASLSRGEVEDE